MKFMKVIICFQPFQAGYQIREEEFEVRISVML